MIPMVSTPNLTLAYTRSAGFRKPGRGDVPLLVLWILAADYIDILLLSSYTLHRVSELINERRLRAEPCNRHTASSLMS